MRRTHTVLGWAGLGWAGLAILFYSLLSVSPPEACAQLQACSGTHKWPNGSEVDVYVNLQSFTARGFNSTAVEHIVRAAVDEWTIAGRANLRVRYGGTHNYSVDTNTESCEAPGAGEDVTIQMNPGANPDNGRVQGDTGCYGANAGPCCIRIWADPDLTTWTEGWPDPDADTFSLWSITTHELGHSLCLAHSDEQWGIDELHEVMRSESLETTAQRFLKPLDIFMLQTKYGNRTNWNVDHRYSVDGSAWGTDGWFDFSPHDPQDGIAIAIAWDTAPSVYTYVAAWSDVDSSDRLKIAYGNGIQWDDVAKYVGSSTSVQVPAVAFGIDGSTLHTVVAYLHGTSHPGSPVCSGGTFCGGHGRNLFVRATSNSGLSWSSPVFIGESFSGPALTHYGGDCFILAYAVWDQGDLAARDKIRTKVSCDGGLTWGSTLTSTVRTTDRPAIAWGDDPIWGGIVWTTNVFDGGSRTGNHLRTGRLQNVWGSIDVNPSPAEYATLFTSNFPALTVADAGAPQPNRYVRIRRRWNEIAGGRQLETQWSTDLATPTWSAASWLQATRSNVSSAYSDSYNEFWTLFTED